MINRKLQEGIDEIAAYRGVPRVQIEDAFKEAFSRFPGEYLVWTHVTAEEWAFKKILHDDPEAVAKFYQETENYIPELIEYHSTPEKRCLSWFILGLALGRGASRVLDYGAGIAEDSILAAEHGLEAIAVDIPGKTFEFAKWRASRRGAVVNFVDLHVGKSNVEILAAVKPVDLISCLEVIQHVVDPRATLRMLQRLLRPGGLLCMTWRFRGNYALALPQHEELEDQFFDIVKSAGFGLYDRTHLWGPKGKGKILYVFQKFLT